MCVPCFRQCVQPTVIPAAQQWHQPDLSFRPDDFLNCTSHLCNTRLQGPRRRAGVADRADLSCQRIVKTIANPLIDGEDLLIFQ